MQRISLSEFEITHFGPEDATREQLEDLCTRATNIHIQASNLIWEQIFAAKDEVG